MLYKTYLSLCGCVCCCISLLMTLYRHSLGDCGSSIVFISVCRSLFVWVCPAFTAYISANMDRILMKLEVMVGPALIVLKLYKIGNDVIMFFFLFFFVLFCFFFFLKREIILWQRQILLLPFHPNFNQELSASVDSTRGIPGDAHNASVDVMKRAQRV